MSEDDKKENFKNTIKGKKAVDALFDAFKEDGILVENKDFEPLSSRVKKLENEVEFLKDLLVKALNKSLTKDVLND